MRLTLKKGQRKAGLTGKKIAFSLDAKVDLSPEEAAALETYKFGSELVYSKQNVEQASYDQRNSLSGIARTIAGAALDLNITVSDLVRGRSVEAKSIGEMMDIEDAINSACANLKAILDMCQSFQGETVIDF